MIRIERRIDEFVVSTEVPNDADPFVLALALRRVEAAIAEIGDLCPGCQSPRGAIHEPSCPFALPGIVERAYAGDLFEGP